MIQVQNRVFGIMLHSAHHSWVVLGVRVWCIHLQFLYYVVGVKGSHWTGGRIPLPWCSSAGAHSRSRDAPPERV